MRIILADDHVIFRDGLKLMLALRPDWQVVGETGDASALRPLVRQLQPDLLIVDYHMPGNNCAAEIAYLKQRHPEIRIVVLTAERSAPLLQQLLAAGADGLLLKDGSGAALLAALERVAAGENTVAASVRELLNDADLGLTSREMQILHLICRGWSNPQIAESMAISPRTVDKHRENILRKFKVNNVVQLANKVRDLNLFSSFAD